MGPQPRNVGTSTSRECLFVAYLHIAADHPAIPRQCTHALAVRPVTSRSRNSFVYTVGIAAHGPAEHSEHYIPTIVGAAAAFHFCTDRSRSVGKRGRESDPRTDTERASDARQCFNSRPDTPSWSSTAPCRQSSALGLSSVHAVRTSSSASPHTSRTWVPRAFGTVARPIPALS